MRTTMIRGLVVVGALCALGGAGVAVSTIDTTDHPAVVADDPGSDPLDADRSTTIPTAATPQPRHGCGTLPIAFDNTVSGYSLCYPEGYGFLSLEDAAPRTTLNALQAASVRIADAATFPWSPGTLPLDAVSRGATILELTTLPSFTPSAEAGDCTPEEALHATAHLCSVRIDPMSGAPDAAGSVLELLSVHDLGGRVVIARSYLPSEAARSQIDLVRSILTTIRALPVEGAR